MASREGEARRVVWAYPANSPRGGLTSMKTLTLTDEEFAALPRITEESYMNLLSYYTAVAETEYAEQALKDMKKYRKLGAAISRKVKARSGCKEKA